MRTGILAEKLGMTQIFTESGELVPVTLLKVECRVLGSKNEDKHGYNAVQIGYGAKKAAKLKKPVRSWYAKIKQEPCQKVCEFRLSDASNLEVGASIKPSHFAKDQFVDVVAKTIGKGFAGPMKRWNFAGLRASHGVSLAHRSHGSTGQCQDPGKVFKGKKMAGRLGNERVTVHNLKIVDVDDEKGLLFIKGAVPGHKGSLVQVKDAIKKKRK
jgi:large subunit ribosomal protein L3